MMTDRANRTWRGQWRRTATIVGWVPVVLLSGVAVADEPRVPAVVEDAAPAGPAVRISLTDAVQRALARNPSFETAELEVQHAKALVEQARAASLPTLVGAGIYTRLDDDRTLGGRVIAARDSIGANLLLTVPIVAPKPWAQWSHANDNVTAAHASMTDVRRQVAVATARAYLAVVLQKLVLKSNQHARDTAKKHFEFAHQRLTGGVGNRIDDTRAAQELAEDEAIVEAGYVGLARAEEALGVLVGTDAPLDAAEDPSLAEPPPLASALVDAAKRSDVVTSEARLRAAEHVVRDDWTDYSPFLTGIAQPFYQNPPSLILPLTGWQAQLVLTVPLYDGGLRYGQANERDVLEREAKVALDGTLRQARSDVRVAFEAMRRADRALAASRDAARLGQQALELATLAYEAGATTNLELIDAQRRARDAESNAEEAADNARQARLDMLSATGRFP